MHLKLVCVTNEAPNTFYDNNNNDRKLLNWKVQKNNTKSTEMCDDARRLDECRNLPTKLTQTIRDWGVCWGQGPGVGLSVYRVIIYH